MIDARDVFRVVTRKIHDFSEEQLQNLTAITWLYRGETKRFLALVRSYAEQAYTAAEPLEERLAAWDEGLGPLLARLENVAQTVKPEGEVTAESVQAFGEQRQELEKAIAQLTADRETLQTAWAMLAKPTAKALKTNEAQHQWAAALAEREPLLKAVQKGLNLVFKLLGRVVELAEKSLKVGALKEWNSREVKAERKALEELRNDGVAVVKQVLYFQQQMGWLQSRFPQGVMVDVPGLCRVIEQGEVEDGSLTPGRYVGVAAQLEDEDEEAFEERMRAIHAELAGLNAEAVELAEIIQVNFEELGI